MAPKPQVTLEHKIEMAQDIWDGMTKSQLIIKYDCGKGTVYRVGKKLDSLLDMNKDIVPDKKKRQKATKFEKFDIEILQWIMKGRGKNMIITGPLIEAVAMKAGQRRGIRKEDFQASNG